MYASTINDHDNTSSSPPPPFARSPFNQPPPSAPSPFNQPPPPPPTVMTGIPVSSTNQSYSQNSKPAQKVQQPPPGSRVPWSSGLFGCFSDLQSCIVTLFFPCVTFGQISEIVDKGSSSCCGNAALYFCILYCFGCPCLYSCFYRTKIRQQYMLRDCFCDSPCDDCLVHCFCEHCALCQEYRELQSRGFTMYMCNGWDKNMERQNRESAMTRMEPVVGEGMSR